MGVILPFTGGRSLIDIFSLMAIPEWHPVEGSAFCLGWWALVSSLFEWPCLLKLNRVYTAGLCGWELKGTPCLVSSPILTWVLWFAVDHSQEWCRKTNQGLILGMQGVQRDGRRVLWVPPAFCVFIGVPGEYLGQCHWAEPLCGPCWIGVTSGGPYANLLCVRYITGKTSRIEPAASIRYTYLILDFYYTLGVNLRILPWLKNRTDIDFVGSMLI